MECNKNAMEIINFNKFNDSINKYNDETKGEFQEFFTSCVLKGGASRNTKLNKYFFIILRCLIFSVFTIEIFRDLIFILPRYLVNPISIAFINLLKYIVINRCAAQIPILNDMCPVYKDLFIEFLNNLEIILIKLGPILKYGIGTIINLFEVKIIYNDSKIYYYLLNNPEFIDDIEYPENTEFIVNKNNYPRGFVQEINSAINGSTQTNTEGIVTPLSTHKIIPINVNKMTYIGREFLITQEEVEEEDLFVEADLVEVDKFITNNNEYIYLNPIYTRFYINIGYLSVNYIFNDEAKNEISRLLKDRTEMKKILQLLQAKYKFPEQFMRNLSQNLGYGYKSSMIKSQEGIINEPTQGIINEPTQGIINENKIKSSLGGKITKSKKHKNVKKSYKLVKKSKRKTRKHYNEVRKKK